MNTASRSICQYLGFFIACTVAGAAHADSWDATLVLERAQELERTLAQGLAAAEVAPPQETTFQQRTRDAAVTQMRHVSDASRELVTKLSAGQGRTATEPLVSQLGVMFRNARKTARDAVPQAQVAPILERAESLILELQQLYAED